MISYSYLSLLVFGFAYSAAVEQVQEGSTPPPAPEDVAHRELTDAGYVIRYGDDVYKYPVRIVPFVRRIETEGSQPTETNEIRNEDEEKGRPLFYFTTYETPDNAVRQDLPTSRPYIEIRRKRDVEKEDAEIPESSKIGKLRRKRTYCNRCGGGGGGYYVPVTYVAYPVYYGGHGGYGGRGKGCNTCGGGYGGGGGGGGGSFSYSSASAQSYAGSFG